MRGRILIAVLLMTAMAMAAEYKNLYKVSHISPSMVGVSCPGNGGDPAVVENLGGVLLISCGNLPK